MRVPITTFIYIYLNLYTFFYINKYPDKPHINFPKKGRYNNTFQISSRTLKKINK